MGYDFYGTGISLNQIMIISFLQHYTRAATIETQHGFR